MRLVTENGTIHCRRHRRCRGFSILELMISVGIGGVVLGALVSQYSHTVATSHDQQVRIATYLQAQATLQMIGSELRMLGNGVPFDQANFQIGEDTLTDPTVTEPIDVATTTASHIGFRINETGDVYLLSGNFNPASTLTFTLTSTTGLEANDPIYLSNSVVAGDDGLFGTIASVDHGTNQVTLQSGVVYSPGATFNMGSICEEVSTVAYDSPADGTGITRDSGYGPVKLGNGSTFVLEFVDAAGTPVALPLTNTTVVNSLRAIRVTVNQQSANKLKDGSSYTATISQSFGIRNLNYLY